MTSTEGKYRPVAFDPKVKLFLKDKKVHFEYIPQFYDVDPVTFQKTVSKDEFPSFIAKEQL